MAKKSAKKKEYIILGDFHFKIIFNVNDLHILKLAEK